MPAFNQRIVNRLKARQENGLERSLTPLSGSNQVRFSHQNREYCNLSGNDYLGLATAPELAKSWQQGIDLYGAGSAASPLVTGYSPVHQTLCDELCDWLGFESAVLFGSGFAANQAVLFTLTEKGDLLIQDRLNHASLMEAGSLSPAVMKRFRHNDVTHAAKLLETDMPSLLVTEGVFSMDGDQAPLVALREACDIRGALMMVDDAHGVGVTGPEGQGSCALAGIKPDLLVVTFGKAFGLSGAAVLCSHSLADYLVQFARHHVYSTAIPPSQAHALTTASRMLRRDQWRRDRLEDLQQVYHRLLSGCPGYVKTGTPIKPFIIGESEVAVSVAQQLREKGHWISAIRPPTVPAGTARLRITLTASHSEGQIESLAEDLTQIMERVTCCQS